MEFKEFKSIFIEKLEKINIKNIEEEIIEKFYNYMELIIEWNQKVNLTAITEPKEIIIKHFIDSLTIRKYIKDNDKIVDIGTGAGFPGIPLNLMNKNNQKYDLVDSLNKRIIFLNEVIKKLELNNINAIHSRAEDFIKGNRETYDIAVSRAVAPLNILLEYLLPYIKVGGKCICMKGSNIDEELKNSENAIRILGGKIETIEKLNLPDTDMERNLIIITKISNTNKIYPRSAGIPKKSPL